MDQIFTGNIISPDSVALPTVQTPLRPNQPITYGRGQAFSVYVKYPVKTKKLLFTISDRTFSTSPPLFQQIVFPNPREAGIAEFFVDTETTLKFTAGLYYWDVFQLRDDGSRDIWAPYNTGTFSIIEFPSSNYLEIDTTEPDDIYNNPNPPCPDGRNATLVLYVGDEWETTIKWTTGESIADLNGYTAYMPVTLNQFVNNIIVELTTQNGRILLDPINGTINLNLPTSVTETLAPGTYYYYLELSKNGETNKLIGGNFIVRSSLSP
jgi:hypothetical protein